MMSPAFLVYCNVEGLDNLFILNEISIRVSSNHPKYVYVGKAFIRNYFRFYIFYIGKDNVKLCTTRLNSNRYKIDIRMLGDFLRTK